MSDFSRKKFNLEYTYFVEIRRGTNEKWPGCEYEGDENTNSTMRFDLYTTSYNRNRILTVVVLVILIILHLLLTAVRFLCIVFCLLWWM